MTTPERKVKDKIVAILKRYGAYYFFPATYGMGRAGVPDIIICYRGLFVAIECKAGKGKTTALQERELANIKKANGIAVVVNETNIDLVEVILNTIEKENNARENSTG